jgi:hypothetical protein
LPIVGSLRSLIFQKIRGSFARLLCIMLRAICVSHFSPGTKVQALHWYHVFQKGARWEAGRHFASAMQRLFLWALEPNGTAAGTRL